MPSRRDEYRLKRQGVADYMQTHDLQAVILTRRCNFAWLTAGGLNHVATNDDGGVASLLITPERTVCVTNTIEAARLGDEELSELGIEVHATAWHDAEALSRDWAERIGDRSAACDIRVPGLPDRVTLLPTDFDELRWRLTEDEIQRYRTLGREVAECLEAAARQARPGMTEFQLAGRIVGLLMERGIQAPVVLVAADERIRYYRHPIPTHTRFARRGMVVAGGQRSGLVISATRLFSFGPIDEELRRRHQAVCAVDAAMMAATRPGKTLGEVFAVAQQAYADVDFADEWTLHHQGGPTGYQCRELKATCHHPARVLVHQAFAWNPSITGTKSEDTLLVGPTGNEILSDSGGWPRTEYEADGQPWARCDILEL